MIRCIVAFFLALLSTWQVGAEVALPNPIETPGAIDRSATRDVICNHTTRERRRVTAAEKRQIFASYNIPPEEASLYEIDHLIPLAVGGANTAANLWPQPWAEADQKDILEVELQRRVCHGVLGQEEAQRVIADDWAAAYVRIIGRLPSGVGEPAPAIVAQH